MTASTTEFNNSSDRKVEETDRWPDGVNGVFRSKSPALRKWKSGPITMNCGQLGGTQAKPMGNWQLLGVTDFYKCIAHRSSETVQSLETYGHPTSSPSTGQTPSEDILVQLLEQGFFELNWCKKKSRQIYKFVTQSSSQVHFPVLVQISSNMCKNQIKPNQRSNGDKTTPTK